MDAIVETAVTYRCHFQMKRPCWPCGRLPRHGHFRSGMIVDRPGSSPMKVKCKEALSYSCGGQTTLPDVRLAVGKERGNYVLPRGVKVHSVRPSADLLFESVATRFKDRAIAVVLTGGDRDGSGGVPMVKKMGGVVIAQDAAAAEVWSMPRSAIETGAVD